MQHPRTDRSGSETGKGRRGTRGSGARSSGAAGRRSAPASRCAPTRRGRAVRRRPAARPASRRAAPSMRRGAAALAWPVGWQFWFSGPAVALRSDALPTGRIDGPEESCGRIDGPGCGAGPLCRFCGLMCKSFDEFGRRVAATESPLYGTATAYRVRRRISDKIRGLVCVAVAVPQSCSPSHSSHPRTPELLDRAPFTP